MTAELFAITTYRELSGVTGCGLRCGLCRPYIERMLTTGEIRFTPLQPRQLSTQ